MANTTALAIGAHRLVTELVIRSHSRSIEEHVEIPLADGGRLPSATRVKPR
jgi:hypothetical protein